MQATFTSVTVAQCFGELGWIYKFVKGSSHGDTPKMSCPLLKFEYSDFIGCLYIAFNGLRDKQQSFVNLRKKNYKARNRF